MNLYLDMIYLLTAIGLSHGGSITEHIYTQAIHRITQITTNNKNNNFFYVLLTVNLSIIISVINQLDAQNFCFTISLFHAPTCFEHMCSSSGGEKCITQPLVSSHL